MYAILLILRFGHTRFLLLETLVCVGLTAEAIRHMRGRWRYSIKLPSLSYTPRLICAARPGWASLFRRQKRVWLFLKIYVQFILFSLIQFLQTFAPLFLLRFRLLGSPREWSLWGRFRVVLFPHKKNCCQLKENTFYIYIYI